ncbi:hypothetical protein BVU76_22445 [Mycolicibacterium porcinum]|nr:hypothetical protein BVU76_22445 [Mycolicibacterium porcinum]
MTIKPVLLARAAAIAAASIAVATAPAASAGCTIDGPTTMCDGPITGDGTWKRCFRNEGFIYGSGRNSGYVPATGNCFIYNPATPPLLPLGQPSGHID